MYWLPIWVNEKDISVFVPISQWPIIQYLQKQYQMMRDFLWSIETTYKLKMAMGALAIQKWHQGVLDRFLRLQLPDSEKMKKQFIGEMLSTQQNMCNIPHIIPC